MACIPAILIFFGIITGNFIFVILGLILFWIV